MKRRTFIKGCGAAIAMFAMPTLAFGSQPRVALVSALALKGSRHAPNADETIVLGRDRTENFATIRRALAEHSGKRIVGLVEASDFILIDHASVRTVVAHQTDGAFVRFVL
ncbi:hypothetical protein AGMMS50229_04940 [Campylobacterota bacterium]|nr:hypothetical protein AGMMS50229_04940 [Campylobacterota bacterium]